MIVLKLFQNSLLLIDMQFIELFGLPGCGKTFLIEKLKKDNKFIKNNIILISFSKRSFLTFFEKTMFIIFSIPNLLFSLEFKKLISFFKELYRPRKSFLISLRTFSIIFNSIYLISIVKFHKIFNKRKKIIIDQGFIQLLLSLLYELDFNDKNLEIEIQKSWFLVFSSLNNKYLVLYCKDNIKNISERLYRRNGDSILEKNNLNNFEIKYIYKKLNCILDVLRSEDFKNNFINLREIQINKFNVKELSI